MVFMTYLIKFIVDYNVKEFVCIYKMSGHPFLEAFFASFFSLSFLT